MVSENMLQDLYQKVELEFDEMLPFKYRGITISNEMIKKTIEILEKAPNRELPQNCRHLSKEETPDGLDRELKYALDTNLRMANIISDVLAEVGTVEVILVENEKTRRMIKHTRLIK